jgi:hypothetical protein
MRPTSPKRGGWEQRARRIIAYGDILRYVRDAGFGWG